MKATRFYRAACAFVVCFGLLSNIADAQINPLPTPLDVPGKAISDWILTNDQDSTGTPNPHLARAWVGDGKGGTDTLDFTAETCHRSTAPFVQVWIVYHSKMKTKQVYLHDSTYATPFSLMLWGAMLLAILAIIAAFALADTPPIEDQPSSEVSPAP